MIQANPNPNNIDDHERAAGRLSGLAYRLRTEPPTPELAAAVAADLLVEAANVRMLGRRVTMREAKP